LLYDGKKIEKKAFGSRIRSSSVYISCTFLSVSPICLVYKKNSLSGLHDFESFLFSLFVYPRGNKAPNNSRFVCILCRLLYTLLFAYLSFSLSHSSVRAFVLFLSAQFMSSAREADFHYFLLSFSHTRCPSRSITISFLSFSFWTD